MSERAAVGPAGLAQACRARAPMRAARASATASPGVVRLRVVVSAVALGTLLGGCASYDSVMSANDLGGRLEYAVVGGLNLYGLGRIDETCGIAGKNLNGALLNRHRFAPVRTPYRVVDLTTTEMGTSLLTAWEPMPIKAFVPNGLPRLRSGDLVLVRPGEVPSPSVAATPDGRSNVVVKLLATSASGRVRAVFGARPTVGHGLAPWPREPWSATVEHYQLRFTPFYADGGRDKDCRQLRSFPETADPALVGFPTWPAALPLD